MMKISKWDEKGNPHHFGSYDTYFPFQQEIPILQCLFETAGFFGKSSKLSPVSKYICVYLSQYKL